MRLRSAAGAGLFTLLLFAVPAFADAAAHCPDCHKQQEHGFNPVHDFAPSGCSLCHAGDPAATSKIEAHRGLIISPGHLEDAERSCGRCHADEVRRVRASLMHTGSGMVHTTRTVLGEEAPSPTPATLSALGHSPADSLLRKLCAGCHLGQPGPVRDTGDAYHRGGGCLACHLHRDARGAHAALSLPVDDSRCFGCHARSGRIAISYAGLAESGDQTRSTSRLADGRRIEVLAADVHHAAGLGGTDCHTGRGLMGAGDKPESKRQAVDITCDACHGKRLRRVALQRWPAGLRAQVRHIPFAAGPETEFPATASGTPLWHIELRGDEAWLHRKDGGGVMPVPAYRDADHPLQVQHARLDCAACHSQWAPQCYGCHMQYDAKGSQWDHLERSVTPGRWLQRRSEVRNDLPPLGVTTDDRIVPVVPGMIMTVEHPDWDSPRFVRRFAPLAPHTIGRARSCVSCHRSPVALGLGQGQLRHDAQGWHFQPDHAALADGLPADAWTSLGGDSGETVAASPARPFSGAEIRRILDAPLDEVRTLQHPSSRAGGGGGASDVVGGVKAGSWRRGAGAGAAAGAGAVPPPAK